MKCIDVWALSLEYAGPFYQQAECCCIVFFHVLTEDIISVIGLFLFKWL